MSFLQEISAQSRIEKPLLLDRSFHQILERQGKIEYEFLSVLLMEIFGLKDRI